MANFGIFAGGLADSYQKQTEQNSLNTFRTKELEIQQQGMQNAEKREQIARLDQIIASNIQTIDQDIGQIRTANPGVDAATLSKQYMPYVQSIAKLAESSGRPGGSAAILAQFASILAKPSPADVQRAQAAAKEPPGQAELRGAQAEYYRGQARLFAPEPDNAGGQTVRTAGGNVAEVPPPVGTGNAMYEAQPVKPDQTQAQPVKPDQTQQVTGGTQYIKTPFTNRQKAIIFQSGATPEQFDFDAQMYAYGNTTVATGYRSYHGINPVTVLRARAAQYWMNKFPGEIGPQQANAVMTEFKAMQHGANTAATIDARMTAALSKAQNTSKILTEPGPSGKSLIDSVDRTQFKDLNDFLVNYRGRTGNQPEIRLAIALETLASNYGVSLGMGNSVLTDMQTKRAQDMLQRGWATGQLKAAVDQINQEMLREEAGTRQGMHKFIGGMTSDMENPGGAAPAAPAAPAGGKPQYKFDPNTGELVPQ